MPTKVPAASAMVRSSSIDIALLADMAAIGILLVLIFLAGALGARANLTLLSIAIIQTLLVAFALRIAASASRRHFPYPYSRFRTVTATCLLALSTIGASYVGYSAEYRPHLTTAVLALTSRPSVADGVRLLLTRALEGNPDIRLLSGLHRNAFAQVAHTERILPLMQQLNTDAVIALDSRGSGSSASQIHRLIVSVQTRTGSDAGRLTSFPLELTNPGLRRSAQFLSGALGVSGVVDRTLPRLGRTPAANADYLTAMSLYEMRTIPAMTLAVARFSQSLSADSNFVLACAGLAETYVQLYKAQGELQPKLLAAARRYSALALRLDGSSPQAHFANARTIAAAIPSIYPTSPNGAARSMLASATKEAQLAAELDPTYADAYAFLIGLYVLAGQTNRAHLAYEQAVAVGPGNYVAYTNEAGVLRAEGRYEEAITLLGRVIGLRPDLGIGYYNLACIYALLHRYAAAAETLKRATKFTDYRYDIVSARDPDLKGVLELSVGSRRTKGNGR